MPEPNFTKFSGAEWIVKPLNKLREWIISDRILKIPGIFRDTGRGWELLPSAVVAAAETGTWAFQPYFVTDESEIQQLRIREGLLTPGSIMPTFEATGTALDDATPPQASGKETGTVAVWLKIEMELNTESFWNLSADETQWREASGGNVIAASIEFTGASTTPPAGTRAGVFSTSDGTVSQTPIIAIQVNTITSGVPQAQNVANVNRPLYIKFCPDDNYQPFPM